MKKKFSPRERAWQERERARTWRAPPDYYLTNRDLDCVEAAGFMLRLARTAQRPGLRKACFHDTGRHLERLRRDRPRLEFAAILKRELSLSLRRGYEIMALTRKNSLEKSTVAQEKAQQNQWPPKPRRRRPSKAKRQ